MCIRDSFNAKEMREDQLMQARYLVGQWEEIYEQSRGKGRVGNAIGGCIFQWSDGWWKYGQDSFLDVHDTHASWPNGGYVEDYVPGENNMNEEWWGICAKGPTDSRGFYELYPRAAWYAMRDAFALDAYAPGTDLEAVRRHFAGIHPVLAKLKARGDKAARMAETRQKVHLSGLRLEFETYSTGGKNITTPPAQDPQEALPAFRGFDHLQSFYTDFEVKPTEAVTGELSLNIVGNVPVNPIDEIFYENRGRRTPLLVEGEEIDLQGLERVKVYRSAVAWDDRLFHLDAFYRTGHTHWGYEGDFFGLYHDAYYGENLDIYNGVAPVGVELAGKKWMDGLKVAFGPELWWGANPAVLVKYRRQVGPFDATAIFQEDFARQNQITSSIAIPLPENRKATLSAATDLGPFGLEMGAIWAGSTLKGEHIYVVEEEDGVLQAYDSEIEDKDTWGGKARLTFEKGRWHWYGEGAYEGAVAYGGPTATTTYTGWTLKDSGSGNQARVATGVAVDVGRYQISPKVVWQKPLIGPIPADAPAPARPRNVLDDPFAVRGNREMTAFELLLSHDPTPATWMWAWDNIAKEDAPLAWSIGYTFRHMPTTMDAAIYISENGDALPFPGATPPRDLWEVRARVVSRLRPEMRLVANLYGGLGEPNGDDPRKINRFGGDATLAWGRARLAAFARFNDWGPYDYHKDFNLTFPVQLMADVSWSLGTPRWFDFPQTRLGIRGTWRTLDQYTPRYILGSGENGREWEIRTYLHVTL